MDICCTNVVTQAVYKTCTAVVHLAGMAGGIGSGEVETHDTDLAGGAAVVAAGLTAD